MLQGFLHILSIGADKGDIAVPRPSAIRVFGLETSRNERQGQNQRRMEVVSEAHADLPCPFAAARRPKGAPSVAAHAVLLCLTLLAPLSGRAWAGAGEACRDQAALAEHAAGIPPGLLLAIGRRESGRADARAAAVLPWPWAVNREGEDHVFESQADAIAYVAAAQRAGSRSIDVGCFQINLKYHPTAFASLDEAFDPAANAAYAARFLTDLHDRTGSWDTAVAWYHSATPSEGAPYRDAVLAIWRGLTGTASPLMLSSSTQPVRVVMGISIWEPSPLVPASLSTAPANSTRGAPMPMMFPHPSNGLPMVITPATTYAPPARIATAVQNSQLARSGNRLR